MSGNGWETLPYVWECSGGPSRCLGVVGRPSRMSRSGQEALPHDRVWSRWPSWMYGSGREALPDDRDRRKVLPNVQEWLGGPPNIRE